MKKIMLLLLSAVIALGMFAQTPEPYEFKPYINLKTTPVKNQGRTGTCWSFSATSFLESELLRMGKGAHDLSEMFTVRYIYRQKCENYVRRLGKAQLDEGGLAHDKLNVVRQYGVVPESVYPGREDSGKLHNHGKLVNTLKSMCAEFVALAEKGKLPDDWQAQIDAVLDAELGPVPITFVYKDVQFTPISFRDYLGLRADDYVNITSFTHHPFWTNFVLEVPDNFSNGLFFNMPLSDMIRCLNFSLQNGYTVEWDADVSNPGFAARDHGLAVVPESGWDGKSKEQLAATFQYWEPEKIVSQTYRQQLFDRMETQDDHLMHITGVVNEENGGIFYTVKNSWGEISDLKGYVYVSEAYMRLNTISLTLHKNSLPGDIRKRMGLDHGDVNIEKDAKAPANDPNTPGTNVRDTTPKAGSGQPNSTRLHRQNPKAEPASKGAPASKE